MKSKLDIQIEEAAKKKADAIARGEHPCKCAYCGKSFIGKYKRECVCSDCSYTDVTKLPFKFSHIGTDGCGQTAFYLRNSYNEGGFINSDDVVWNNGIPATGGIRAICGSCNKPVDTTQKGIVENKEIKKSCLNCKNGDSTGYGADEVVMECDKYMFKMYFYFLSKAGHDEEQIAKGCAGYERA